LSAKGRATSTATWRAVFAVGASCTALALGACGGDDDSTSGGGGGSTTSAGGDGDLVAQAKTVQDNAKKGMVYGLKQSPVSPDELEAYGEWRGPTKAPTPPKSANAQIILCTKQAASCVDAGNAAAEAAKTLGWTAEVIDGGGTPEGFARAYDTAMGRKADAIIGIAVPAAAVANKLAAAKKAGIVTVAAGDIPPEGGAPAYDAYVPFPMPTMNAVIAYSEIADNNGKANTILIEDPGFPSLTQAADDYRAVMKQCSGCKVETVKWQITDASDPNKASNIITSALSKNPDATAVVMPYGIGMPAVIQAVRSAGKSDKVDVIAKDADPVGLQAVAAGESPYNVGTSSPWAGWASIDQAIRGLAKQPYLDGPETGIGIHEFTKEDTPSDGKADSWDGMTDYEAQYKKIWKVG
jgi:ribose transport system substrate-binding protein